MIIFVFNPVIYEHMQLIEETIRSMVDRGVQYMHCVMLKCIMVKLRLKKGHQKFWWMKTKHFFWKYQNSFHGDWKNFGNRGGIWNRDIIASGGWTPLMADSCLVLNDWLSFNTCLHHLLKIHHSGFGAVHTCKWRHAPGGERSNILWRGGGGGVLRLC